MPTRGLLQCRGLVPTLGQRLVVLLLGGVQIVHVGRVVLAVVQLHDLRADVRRQRAIVVRQVGEAVLVPGARDTGRRAQPPARAEDRGDAASGHRQATSRARRPETHPTEDAAARVLPAHLLAARHSIAEMHTAAALLRTQPSARSRAFALRCPHRVRKDTSRRRPSRPLPSAEGRTATREPWPVTERRQRRPSLPRDGLVGPAGWP